MIRRRRSLLLLGLGVATSFLVAAYLVENRGTLSKRGPHSPSDAQADVAVSSGLGEAGVVAAPQTEAGVVAAPQTRSADAALDPTPAPALTDSSALAVLAGRALSADELLRYLHALPDASIDRRVLLASAYSICSRQQREVDEISRGLIAAGFVTEATGATALAVAWRAQAQRFCGDSQPRLEALWAAGAPDADPTEGDLPLESLAPSQVEERLKDALKTLATTVSPFEFQNAAISLAELEVGPFAPEVHPRPGDPAVRARISLVAIEHATCTWSNTCGPGSIWAIQHCLDAGYCQPNADYRMLLSQMLSPNDLRRVEHLSQQILVLRARGP